MDYHRFETQYRNSLTRLWKRKISDEDKSAIEQFLKSAKSEGVGYARLRKLCQVLMNICEELPRGFEKAREKDIRRIVLKYEDGTYSVWTRHDVRVVIKQFYRWQNNGSYPDCVNWINTTIPYREKIPPKEGDMLTEDEMNKVIELEEHPRNKALLAVLAESGARIGEIGNLTISQVHIDPSGAILNVIGKTGHRRIRIITSTPYLVAWLNNHPARNNPSAPVWVTLESTGKRTIMSYEAIRKVIKKAFLRAGLKKRCHPYIFRHSRISQMAHHLTEFQMNAYFGWVQGSRMPSTYVHISGKDLDDHILRINGMKPGETPHFTKPQNRMCPRCKEINTPTALYCSKCAEIVDPGLSIKLKMEMGQEQPKVKSPFMEWLQTDPEMQNVLKKKLAEFHTVVDEGNKP